MVTVESIIDKKELAIQILKKFKLFLFLYIGVVIVNFLIWAGLMLIYGYFSIINDWYDFSIFFYFIYPLFTIIWMVVSLFIDYMVLMSIRERIKGEEIGEVIFKRNKIFKIRNIFWDLYKIININKVIKLLKNNKPNTHAIISVL